MEVEAADSDSGVTLIQTQRMEEAGWDERRQRGVRRVRELDKQTAAVAADELQSRLESA